MIYKSGEDYLETIYTLSKSGKGVHAVHIARALNYSKPSVTRAMKILSSLGYITICGQNHIELTEAGKKKAEQIVERHNVITQFWLNLGVSKENAEKDACLMEHEVSEETFQRIKEIVCQKKNIKII